MSQVCRICKTEKILSEFIFRKDSNKHRTECKECRTQENRDWRQKPKAEKEILPENIIRCKTCQQIKHETEFAIRSDTGLRRNQCILCRNAYVAEFKRSEEQKAKQRIYTKYRRETEVDFFLKSKLRSRLGKVLRSIGTCKSNSTLTLTGCTIHELKNHIEKQFTGNMNWEEKNFVVDHIIPISFFDLTQELHQKVCFHYTNLQPLTWEENTQKSDKILDKHMDFFNLVKSKLGTNVDLKESTGRENNSDSKNPTDDVIVKRKIKRKTITEIGNPQPST
jgi:hypothetical protein